MTSFTEAVQTILDTTRVLGIEKVKLAKCHGRILAEDVVAKYPVPRFAASAKDGYAASSTDLLYAGPGRPIELIVVGEATAGNPYERRLESGQTTLITTGAKIPEGADAVVRQEDVELLGRERVSFSQTIQQGAHVRSIGADVREGEKVLAVGDCLHGPEIGLLGALGLRKISVRRRPAVNILATGDELVDLDEEPEDGQIRSSSSHLLASLLLEEGARPSICGIVADKKKKIRRRIEDSLECDLLVITGGTSKGKHDFVGTVLEELGVELKIRGVRIRPGRPMLFGTLGDTQVFGLPGSPLSSYITYLVLVRPALARMLGRSTIQGPQLMAPMVEPYKKDDDRRAFFLGELMWDGTRLRVRRIGDGETQVLLAMVKGNCLVTIPEDRRTVNPGDMVAVEMLPGRPLSAINDTVSGDGI